MDFKSVVSGKTEPDTIVLKRSFQKPPELKIDSVAVGKKDQKVVLNNNSSGIKTEDINETNKKSLSLTEDQALRLGYAAWKIEKSFGYSLDIEWAFENVKIKRRLLHNILLTNCFVVE